MNFDVNSNKSITFIMQFYRTLPSVEFAFIYMYGSRIFNLIFIFAMKSKSKTIVLSEIGTFLIDVSKLVFGGVILASIMRNENINQWFLLMVGIILMLICFITGLTLIGLSQRKGK